MRESYFRKTRQEYWDFIKDHPAQDPDQLAENFMEISQDLSFAKTFYPKSDLVPYLNEFTRGFYSKIYKNKKEKKNAIKKYLSLDLPLLFYKYRKQVLYSFLFFAFFCLLGALAAAKNPDFVRIVLGSSYINMTDENIDNGQPFGVYNQMDPIPMFFIIMLNNIYVSFQIFTSGIFLGAGTLWNLFLNGIMLGSFQYYFFSKGLGWPSVLVIWIHGTLEISSIIIAGSAGLVLGKGLLFPGTWSRLEALKMSALDGIKMMIGLIPFFIVAAWLESFITRHDHMPKWVSISILFISLCFVLFYFVFYPRYLYKNLIPKNKSYE